MPYVDQTFELNQNHIVADFVVSGNIISSFKQIDIILYHDKSVNRKQNKPWTQRVHSWWYYRKNLLYESSIISHYLADLNHQFNGVSSYNILNCEQQKTTCPMCEFLCLDCVYVGDMTNYNPSLPVWKKISWPINFMAAWMLTFWTKTKIPMKTVVF